MSGAAETSNSLAKVERRLAPEDPLLQRQQLELALQAGGLATWLWSPATDALEHSAEFGRLLGLSGSQTLQRGRDFLARVHPDDRQNVEQSLQQTLRQTGTCRCEYRLLRGESETVWVQSHARVVNSGSATGVCGMVRDISGERKTEQTLLLSDQRYRALVESVADAIWIWCPESGTSEDPGGLRWWESVSGQSPEEQQGDGWLDAVHPEDRQRTLDAWRAALESRTRYEAEFRLRSRTGEWRHISARCVPIPQNGSPTTEWIGAVTDTTERRRAEEAVRQSRYSLEAVLEASPLAISLMDGNGVVQLWNSAATRLFGWTREEVLGRLTPTVPPEKRAEFQDNLRRSMRDEPLKGQETVRWRKDGQRVDVALWSSVLRDAEGKPERIVSIVADIGERKRAADAVEAARARLQTVTDSMPAYVAHCSADRRYLWINQGYAERLGLTPNEVAGRTLAEVLGERAAASLEQYIGRVLAGETVEFEIEVPFRTTGSRWVRSRYAPTYDAARNVDGWVAVVTDVTERRALEDALRQSEERFRSLADNIAQFAWMADGTGWIFWYNQRWFDYTGTTLEEMEGWGWTRVQHPDHLEGVVQKFSACIRNGQVWEDTFPLRSKDGTYRWFLSRAVPIRDAEGQVVRWLGTNTDITDQREVEQTLRESDRRKSEFLALLGHELRNPLAAVVNGMHVLAQHVTEEAGGQVCDLVQRQARHMARLIDDLLDLTRISRGKITLRLERIDLVSLVQKTAADHRSAIEQSRCALLLRLPDKPVWLQADPTRLAQVLSNLLHNACKFTNPGGEVAVEVAVDCEANQATVSIRDSGIGMSRATIKHLFEPFMQANTSLDRSCGGLGLGLALVKGLVELHGGRIEAHSDGLGQGSAFQIRLPILADETHAETQRPSEAAPEETAAETYRVLVIEDSEPIARIFALLLRGMGHQVEVASSGAAALEMLARFAPEVVFSDISMPGMSGYEVAQRIRQQPAWQDVMLVAMTGYGQDDDRKLALQAGFDRHLVKPAELDDIEQVFAELAARRGQQG